MKAIIVVLCGLFLITKCCEYREENFDLLLKYSDSELDVTYQYKNGLTISISRAGKLLQKIYSDENFGTRVTRFGGVGELTLEGSNGNRIKFTVMADTDNYAEVKVLRSKIDGNLAIRDCIDLDKSTYYFGGPEQSVQQFWPINKQNYPGDYAYVPKYTDSCDIAERYWVTSSGVYFYIAPEAPLFISQTPDTVLCLKTQQKLPYDETLPLYDFEYYIGIAADAKEAHMKAIERHLGKPTGYPDERMIQHPVWSTWARYYKDIDDSIIRGFAEEIRKNGFQDAQLEIDDLWETCYGSLEFDKSKFPNPKKLITDLKADGFRVTLWVHPFINQDCEPIFSQAKGFDCLVKSRSGSIDTTWWNSKENGAALFDFTKPTCVQWFKERLEDLITNSGIDSFKFDAGESEYAPKNAVFQGEQHLAPTLFTKAYVKFAAQFGSFIEVRVAAKQQNLPNFVRMIDLDSYNELEKNGLRSLIPTLFAMTFAGYPFVLPDMVGGNGYGNVKPSKQLFIRWMQANTFMPSIQFSFVPWDYDNQTIEIAQSMLKLRSSYTPTIINAFKKAVSDGTPVITPIWWGSSKDEYAFQCSDEFLMGGTILVAPILDEKQYNRDVYLPEGKWKDGNGNDIFDGPMWIYNKTVSINDLIWFIKL